MTRDQVRQIAETKMPDLNANDIDAAMKIVEGTARSMGITVRRLTPAIEVGGRSGRSNHKETTMAKKSKAQAEALRSFDRQTLYSAGDALGIVRTVAHAKFDESIDAVFTLGIDPRKADQLVRGTVSLPHGTGKSMAGARVR